MPFDKELNRVIVALVIIVGLSVCFSLITVVGTLKGHEKILGWLAWITLWTILVFSALRVQYPMVIIYVFGGLVVYFSHRVSHKDSRKEQGDGDGYEGIDDST